MAHYLIIDYHIGAYCLFFLKFPLKVKETKNADIVVMAIGKAKFLKKEHIKQGAILIDVGINFEGGRIVGDIDYEDIEEKAEACTPVPGGVGAVTNAVLINNILK